MLRVLLIAAARLSMPASSCFLMASARISLKTERNSSSDCEEASLLISSRRLSRRSSETVKTLFLPITMDCGFLPSFSSSFNSRLTDDLRLLKFFRFSLICLGSSICHMMPVSFSAGRVLMCFRSASEEKKERTASSSLLFRVPSLKARSAII